MLSRKIAFAACLSLFSVCAITGEGFSEGTPVAVQKSDWSTLHLTFVQTSGPVDNPANCSADNGYVIHDDSPSAKSAVTFALVALGAGMKFRCYVTTECSQVTGAAATYPVCGYYPSVKQ
jgi:hypothetical protein